MSKHLTRGTLFIVSAPSGTGKSTLLERLVGEDSDIAFSVSHTTRSPRGEERHGQAYYFVNQPTFEQLIEEGAFLEWAKVHGHYYGTSRAPVLEHLDQGRDVIVDIDVAGAAQIKKQMATAVGIFVLPPDYRTLKMRLVKRAQDEPRVIEKRLRNACDEIARIHEYDYVLFNDDLDLCYRRLTSIVAAGRCRIPANKRLVAKVIASFKDHR